MTGFSKDNTTIFSIDMNNGFAKEGALASRRVFDLIAPTAAFLDRAKSAGIEIIGLTDSHDPDSLEFSDYPPHCLAGSVESDIVAELKPFMDRIIPKNSTNAFFAFDGPYLDGFSYIITGCCTDICIYQFAVTLRAYLNHHRINARVIVPRDLSDTFDAEGHDAAAINEIFFASMAANGVEVPANIIL